MKIIAIAAALGLFAGAASAATIDFEGYTSGDVIAAGTDLGRDQL